MIGDEDDNGVIDKEELKEIFKGMRTIFKAADKITGACDGQVEPTALTLAIYGALADAASGDAAGEDDALPNV